MKNKFSFETAPTIHGKRSRFDLSHSQTTTCTVGRLQPFLVQEVYPGDTFEIDETSVIKVTSNFIKPPTGNINFETYYFFVPNRLVYNKWENVVGNDDEPDGWEQTERDRVPMVKVGNIANKSIADFMRIPVFANGNTKLKVTELPFRAFALIFNDWFRNENFQRKTYVNLSYTSNSSLNSDAWGYGNYLGMCPSVNKYKDIFTTALPQPQKGESIEVPFSIPQTLLDTVETGANVRPARFKSNKPLAYRWGYPTQGNEDLPVSTQAYIPYQAGFSDDYSIEDRNYNLLGGKADGGSDGEYFVNGEGFIGEGLIELSNNNPMVMGTNMVFPKTSVTGFTIDDLYKAIALQRANYLQGIGGSRYIELLRSIWNVDSPDARLQRPELIYGNITPINYQQVAQTTGTDTKSLANLASYSNTLSKIKFYKGFVEHGYIIGVCCMRQKHLYQQGVERFWLRENADDFYNPLFANIGEVNVHRAELYAQNTHNADNELIPFGYNEAYYDLRYRPSAITGQANSYADDTLDVWHFGDKYGNAPVLGEDFIKEVPNFVNRSLAVDSDAQDQFIVDTRFNIKAIRRLPVRSIPGIQSVY